MQQHELAAEHTLQRQSLDLGALDFADQTASLLAPISQRRFSIDVVSPDQTPLLSTGAGLTLPHIDSMGSFAAAAQPIRNSVDNSGLPIYPLRASALYGSTSQTAMAPALGLAGEIVPEHSIAPSSQADVLLGGPPPVPPRRTGASLDYGAQQRQILMQRLSMDGAVGAARRPPHRHSAEYRPLDLRISLDGLM